MKKEYIITGEAQEVDKVIRENRIRVERGMIKFVPVPTPEDTKAPDAIDTKDVTPEDTKTPKGRVKKS